VDVAMITKKRGELVKPKGSRYSPKERGRVVHAIVRLMATRMTLEEACERMGINAGMVRGWILKSEEFGWMYRQGRLMFAQSLVDEALRVANESTIQTVNVDRLKVDTYLKVAAKMNPAEFGDRQILDSRVEGSIEVKVVEEEGPKRTVERRAIEVAVAE
jgi:hypothetical protein